MLSVGKMIYFLSKYGIYCRHSLNLKAEYGVMSLLTIPREIDHKAIITSVKLQRKRKLHEDRKGWPIRIKRRGNCYPLRSYNLEYGEP